MIGQRGLHCGAERGHTVEEAILSGVGGGSGGVGGEGSEWGRGLDRQLHQSYLCAEPLN